VNSSGRLFVLFDEARLSLNPFQIEETSSKGSVLALTAE
jgi:hypothetical protein